jgi:hypothetical protein
LICTNADRSATDIEGNPVVGIDTEYFGAVVAAHDDALRLAKYDDSG